LWIKAINQLSIAYDYGRGDVREKSQLGERYNLMLLSLVADDYRNISISYACACDSQPSLASSGLGRIMG
jgi:hypothetical protein